MDKRLSLEEREVEKNRLLRRLEELEAMPADDWHMAFEAAIRIALYKYRDRYSLIRETRLGNQPPRADYLIIKSEPEVRFDLPMFSLFRKHNIVEYKRPDDQLNERIIRKAIGYANFYIGTAEREREGDVPSDEVTISLFHNTMNDKLLSRMKAEQTIEVDTNCPGLYYVRKLTDLPMQIVIGSELEGTEYAAFRALTSKPSLHDIEQLIRNGKNTTDSDQRDDYRMIFELIGHKNPGIFLTIPKGGEKMGDIFFDQIFADEYKQRIKENTEQVTKQVTKEVAEKVTSNYIRRLMDSLNVDVNKVFELLNIAPSEQEEYIRLIKHT
ncbi:MAG: hypothetical protein IJ242_08735 [Clostridia bacterium]|nr:hypothetical protein [Clostridia bacterium]